MSGMGHCSKCAMATAMWADCPAYMTTARRTEGKYKRQDFITKPNDLMGSHHYPPLFGKKGGRPWFRLVKCLTNFSRLQINKMGQRLREVRAWKRGITSHDGDTLADRNQNLNVFDE